MHALNLGLHAKQSLKLIQEPDSLVAKTLKAKYLFNTSFLDAVVKLMLSMDGGAFVLLGQLLRGVLNGKLDLENLLQFRMIVGSHIPLSLSFSPLDHWAMNWKMSAN